METLPSLGLQNKCGEGSKCKGWTMAANYTVKTTPSGESVLKVLTKVTSPKKIRKTSIFGAGWALSVSPQLTEGYLAMWMYQ